MYRHNYYVQGLFSSCCGDYVRVCEKGSLIAALTMISKVIICLFTTVDGLDNCPLVYNPHQSSKDPARYGSKCTTPSRSSAMRMDYDDISPVGSDKKGLAAEIMEKLLEMYYSN